MGLGKKGPIRNKKYKGGKGTDRETLITTHRLMLLLLLLLAAEKKSWPTERRKKKCRQFSVLWGFEYFDGSKCFRDVPSQFFVSNFNDKRKTGEKKRKKLGGRTDVSATISSCVPPTLLVDFLFLPF